jgi:hypothetical protein
MAEKTQTDPKQSLAEQLQKLEKSGINHSVMVGFDGYVDSLYGVVQKKSGTEKEYFPHIADFASHLKSLSGKSGQVELALKETKIGGNAPIMSQALGALGFQVHCLGTLGLPKPHQVFEEFHENIDARSLAMPGQSDAFEFEDGKLIFSDCGSFDDLDWNKVKAQISIEGLKDIYLKSQLIAAVDWVNLPHASNIWQGLLEEVVSPNGQKEKKFFFDLADPSRKSKEEIRHVLQIISGYSTFGDVALGLNENETNIVYEAIGNTDVQKADLEEKSKAIFGYMSIGSLVIHLVDRSFAITKTGICAQKGRLVKQPKILTGGGDNFNAGYTLGWLLGVDMSQRLLLGMACSGSYIQNGHSPDISELTEYLKHVIVG